MTTPYPVGTILVAAREYGHTTSFYKVKSYTKGGNMRVALLQKESQIPVAGYGPGDYESPVWPLETEAGDLLARYSKKDEMWSVCEDGIRDYIMEAYDPEGKYWDRIYD